MCFTVLQVEPPAKAVSQAELAALPTDPSLPSMRERAHIAMRASGAAMEASQRAAAYSAAASSAASRAAEAAEQAAAAAAAVQVRIQCCRCTQHQGPPVTARVCLVCLILLIRTRSTTLTPKKPQ